MYKRYPFTIILKEIVDNFRPKTPYRLKIDYGSKHTGLAIVRGEEVLWLAQLDHRTDINNKNNFVSIATVVCFLTKDIFPLIFDCFSF
ncbi:RRXRR domain-containing protein [Anoxybacillus flavithermus]